MYALQYSDDAKKFLKQLDKHTSKRIVDRIEKLGSNPIPSDSKFIGRDATGEKIFRYRIGDYRTLYKVKYSEETVLIAKIDKRSRAYD